MGVMLKTVDTNKLLKDVLSHFKDGIRTFSTCHKVIDQYYTFMLGNCTDITGYPYSGKTLFLIEILFNLSKTKGFKHLLHLPDSGKPAEVIANLIHKYTGKSFEKKHENVISEDEIIKCYTWISEHFKILEYDKRPTPIEFWEYAETLDVQTACIDSWNYMRHESSGTEYLAEQLSARNEIAERSKKHFFTIIHPRNPNSNDYDKDGILKPPDVFNLMGGSEWNNNGKNIIAIHKENKESLNFDIYVRKTKPRQVGSVGIATLQYDIKKQKYYNMTPSGNLFADYDYAVNEFEIVKGYKENKGMKIYKDENIQSLEDFNDRFDSNSEGFFL